MGYCRDCMYFSRSYEEKRFLQPTLYGCTLFNKYVTADGSCSKFEKDTYKKGESEGAINCFLTSACVSYLGKADDCAELTALRKFRDTYMISTEKGSELVEEYYKIAPKIVEKIDASDKKELYYRYINAVIDKCVILIEQGENELTLNEYKNMVLFLKKDFEV